MFHLKIGGSEKAAVLGPSISLFFCILLISACSIKSQELPRYHLNLQSDQGTVLLDPPGGVYSQGQKVKLTCYPFPGYQFSHWSGNLSSDSPSISVTMVQDINLTTHYTPGITVYTWPDSTNTGVPAGTILTPYSGPNHTVSNNQLFVNLAISNRIYVYHSGAVFSNCILTPGSNDTWTLFSSLPGHNTPQGGTGLTVDHCDITGAILIVDGFTARYNHIHASPGGYRKDGIIITFASDVVLENNLIDGLRGPDGAHLDGIQIMGGTNYLLRNNWVDVRAPAIPGGGVNAAIYFDTNPGPIVNVIG